MYALLFSMFFACLHGLLSQKAWPVLIRQCHSACAKLHPLGEDKGLYLKKMICI